MSDEERHQLLCQLRLLRALGALPAAADLSPEERACVAAALEIERDLQQQREQANNLEGAPRDCRRWAVGGWVDGVLLCASQPSLRRSPLRA